MTELTTTKPINISQLSFEMGRVPLRCVGPDADGAYKLRFDEPITEAAAAAAVEAHSANPSWTDPNPPPPTKSELRAQDAVLAQEEAERVRAKAKAVFDGTDTFTNAQIQKIVAGLVLRAAR